MADVTTPSPTDMTAARLRAERFNLSTLTTVEIVADSSYWLNQIARYQADIEAQDFEDGVEGQLRGGIQYADLMIETNTKELERRKRAAAYGFRDGGSPSTHDFAARFEKAKHVDCRELMRELSGAEGRRSGEQTVFECFLHSDDEPSLTCYPPPRGWHCFQCGAGGDAVALVSAFKSIGPGAALALLESGSLGVRVPQ